MKLSAMLLRLICCWLMTSVSGFAGDTVLLKESELKEAGRVLRRIHESEREDELQGAELKNRAEVIVYSLGRGEFRFLDAAAEKKDMDMLWYVLMEATRKNMGDAEIRREHPDTLVSAPLITALNEKIVSYVRLKIAAIPGHAQVLGSRFERMSQDVGYFWRRREIMRCLQMVGSMEAIQQIGRFLEDKRAPDFLGACLAFEMSTDYVDSAVNCRESNASLAAHAMARVLGADSLVRLNQEKIMRVSEISAMQDWWKSDAAKPYREWRPDAGPVMPPTEGK